MWEILTKTCFSTQSEPHRAELCFSIFLKHFLGNSHRASLFHHSERSTELRRKFVFLSMFEKGKS